MRPEERRKLTWEDATERFLDVAELKPGERPKGWEEALRQAHLERLQLHLGCVCLSAEDSSAQVHYLACIALPDIL